MTIGVHISKENNQQNLLLVAINNISSKNYSDHFILFTEKNIENLSENCIQIIITPKPKKRLLLYYWYSYKLPNLLLKYAAQVFISDAGMLAPLTNIKQYLFFSDIVFEKDKNVFF